jgi:AbiJ-like protein
MDNTVTSVTRRNIVDFFDVSTTAWAGRLNDDEFLARIFDLNKLPSQDHRFKNAAGDIHQHTVNNDDWMRSWVFTDQRFNLIHSDDETFVRFLCETVHPVVRPDTDAALKLVEKYNEYLAADGWRLVIAKEISGKPVFGAQSAVRTTVSSELTGWQKVDRQLQETRLRLDTAGAEEQFQTVGLLCREVLITAAQEVYDGSRHPLVDDTAPSDTDAKRMLEAIFETELAGSANAEARAHAKAAVRLAQALQHKRTADFRTAALCAEGAVSVVNMLAIVAGRRAPRSADLE